MRERKLSAEQIKAAADRAEGKASDEPAKARGRGRPSSYKPEFVDQATKLCTLGATDAEIADFFEVNVATLNRWKAKYPEFCASLKTGKAEADERVERSLYQRAIGYVIETEKVFQFQGDIVRADTREHIQPDTTACIFWLKNRRPDLWRDKHEMEHKVDESIAERLSTTMRILRESSEQCQPIERKH